MFLKDKMPDERENSFHFFLFCCCVIIRFVIKSQTKEKERLEMAEASLITQSFLSTGVEAELLMLLGWQGSPEGMHVACFITAIYR